MGSDLSIAVRTCVEAPHCTKETQWTSQEVEGTDSYSPKCYTELRLVDTSSPESPDSILQSQSGVELELLVAECTPGWLSDLDTRAPKVFLRLKEVLCCPKCAGRVGLVVDSSASVGRRLHVAEHRRVFTQCLSALLTKLVLAMKENVSEEGSGGLSASMGKEGSACRDESALLTQRYELFLLDLHHCLLDDASGPWIVRDFLEHVGNSRHQHSAVSQVHDEQRSRSSSIMSYCLSPSARERLSTSYTSLQFLMTENDGIASASAASEAVEQVFCASLRNVRLSENNMSSIGMRKCLEELVACKDRKKGRCLGSLEFIDIRQNEETIAAQRLVAHVSAMSNVHILVGNSGLRWRYQSGIRYSVGLASRLGRSLSHTTDVIRCALSEEPVANAPLLTPTPTRFSMSIPLHLGCEQKTNHYDDGESVTSVGVVTDVMLNRIPDGLSTHLRGDAEGNNDRCSYAPRQGNEHQSEHASTGHTADEPEGCAGDTRKTNAIRATSGVPPSRRHQRTFVAAPHLDVVATNQTKGDTRMRVNEVHHGGAPRLSSRRTTVPREAAVHSGARFLRSDKPNKGTPVSFRDITSERVTAPTARPSADVGATGRKMKGAPAISVAASVSVSLRQFSRDPPKRVKEVQ